MSDKHPVEWRPSGPPEQSHPSNWESVEDHRPWSDDPRSEFRRYVDILVRRWRTVAVIFVLVVGAVITGTLLQEPVYRATALLEIRQPSAGQAPDDALASPERISATALATERGLLESPALARRVVIDLDLHQREAFKPSNGAPVPEGASQDADDGGDVPSEAELQVAVEEFLERLVIHPLPDSRLVEVSFDYENPAMAARIVNATLANHTNIRLESAQRAMEWMDSQLDSLRTEVERSEEALREYADAHDLPYVVEENLAPRLRERVLRLEDELAEAESRRYETESVYDQVMSGEDHEATGDPVMEELATRRSELQQEYANLSSVFTDDYPEVRRVLSQLEEVESLMEEERERIARDAESRHRLAQRQEEALQRALEEERSAVDALKGRSGSYYLLRSRVLANRELFASLQEKRGEVNVSSALEATGIGVVNEAMEPVDPHRPILIYNLALALMAGLVLGVGGAFLREFLDDTVHTGQELGVRPQVPVLAMIPSIQKDGSWWRSRALARGEPRIDARLAPGEGSEAGDMLTEALGILRTAVLFRRNGTAPRSLAISSCRPEEGKTTVGLNLGLSLARLDRKVLLVDADLRRSGLSQAANVDGSPGLADHLRKGGDWRRFVQLDPRESRLPILTSGGPTPDASELLSHRRFTTMLREAEDEYELVIVDGPPLFINVPDARILAEVVSGVLIVARSEQTSSSVLGQVLETTPNVLGIVLNDLNVGRLPPQYRRFFTPYPEGYYPRGAGGHRRHGHEEDPASSEPMEDGTQEGAEATRGQGPESEASPRGEDP